MKSMDRRTKQCEALNVDRSPRAARAPDLIAIPNGQGWSAFTQPIPAVWGHTVYRDSRAHGALILKFRPANRADTMRSA